MGLPYNAVRESVNEQDRPPNCIAWGSEIVPPESEISIYRCFDTVYLGLFVQWSGSRILEKMQRGKELAQEKYEPIPFDIGGAIAAILHPNGKKGGYRYHLQVGDINLFFSTHDVDSETPNVYVEIGSHSLNELGLNTVEARLESWINMMGGSIEDQKLSRVDLAADFVGIDISKIHIDNHLFWITRAKDTAVHHYKRITNSVRAGTSDLILRIYDKRLELHKKKATAKEELFNELWSDTSGPVTRVEFQIRKRVLKSFKIKSVTELFTHSNGLWEYLVKEWFRIAAREVNRNNTEDERVHPFWKIVQSVSWHGFQTVQRAKKFVRRNIDQLIKQATGCLESMAIAMRRTLDLETIIDTIKEQVEETLEHLPNGKKERRKRAIKLAECIEFNVVPF